MRNTLLYIALLIFSGIVASYLPVPLYLKVLAFIVVYYAIFILFEILDIFAGMRIWDQTERTTNCYDWFVHYFKKDYGIVDGENVYDYSENIYFDDFTASSKQSLHNKYNMIFNELNLSPGKRVLDCGCGIGTWMEFCKSKGVEVVGLTLSEEQKDIILKKGLEVYVKDYRILDEKFIGKFDAISVLGSTEHITISSGYYQVDKNSYKDYSNLFKVLKQYLKPEGKILLTVLVQNKPPIEWSSAFDHFQAYLCDRHYGGYYSHPDIISKAITDNHLTLKSVDDYTRDYHWISVAEPDHFGHWWVHWEESPLDKVVYFIRGLATDPFLLHHWLYYGMDSWMWQFGGYQKTPLTDEQIKNAPVNLKYFSISA
jgi:cyclopropane fatty-acyl-phospholipid synthase-like methyltransferase